MNITEMFLLANESCHDLRITCVNRWMVMDETSKEFVVYEKIPYKRNTHVICRTENEEIAISYLLGERE